MKIFSFYCCVLLPSYLSCLARTAGHLNHGKSRRSLPKRQRLPPGRGYGDGKTQKSEDVKLLGDLQRWYDWTLNPRVVIANESYNGEFVSMAWGKQHDSIPLKEWLAQWKPDRSTRHVLGFNVSATAFDC